MTKKHILFLPRWYTYKDDPMFGLFVKNHALAVKNFYEVSILFAHPVDQQREVYHVDVSEEEGLYTVRIFYLKPTGGLKIIDAIKTAFRFWKANKMGLGEIKKHKGLPDLTHVNVLTRHGVFAWWIKRKYSTPYIITEHWSRYLPKTGTFSGFLRKIATRFVVRHAAAVTTVSENLQKAMKHHRLYNKNYKVVYNVVDTERFRISERADKFSLPHRFVHISCFEDRAKNISGILSTLKELANTRSDWESVFVGVGEDYELLTEYAAELGLTPKHVKFVGMQQGDDLVQTIQDAEFLILFSNYENMPVVLSEAFACGKPVVSTNVGGIAEIVNEDRGLLVAAGDETAFLKALEQMLDSSSEYTSEELREFAIQNFSATKVGERFHGIYKDVLQHAK